MQYIVRIREPLKQFKSYIDTPIRKVKLFYKFLPLLSLGTTLLRNNLLPVEQSALSEQIIALNSCLPQRKALSTRRASTSLTYLPCKIGSKILDMVPCVPRYTRTLYLSVETKKTYCS